jgi:catechol 2,3-dioxygenase-like lactoylglutathione lyase family enzyme
LLHPQIETQSRKEQIMKRFHVHVAVDDLAANIRFYSNVFGIPPTVEKPDYAKWMIEDPRLNFAISSRSAKPGIDHLGLQVESDAELQELRKQVAAAEITAFDQQQAVCCYAESDKYWITDPQGVQWETYHTLAEAEMFGADTAMTDAAPIQSCCAPLSQSTVAVVTGAKQKSCC